MPQLQKFNLFYQLWPRECKKIKLAATNCLMMLYSVILHFQGVFV